MKQAIPNHPEEVFQELKEFIQNGFRNPKETFDYLKKRKKCDTCKSPCDEVRKTFKVFKSEENPWIRNGVFFQWCYSTWCPPTKDGKFLYEWPIRTVFVNSIVAQFLFSKGIPEDQLSSYFIIEFTGKPNDPNTLLLTPPCFLRKSPLESTGRGTHIYFDFSLMNFFPATAAEVKVATPNNLLSIRTLEDDISKCKKWLDHFKYTIEILIDLTGGEKYKDLEQIIKTPHSNILLWRISGW